MHQHRADPKARRETGFSGPVARPENTAAHGNITVVDTCSCGAVRRTNINDWHVERGEWEADNDE